MKSGARQPWEVTSEKVEAAIRKIIEVSQPDELILFGSYLEDATAINSDVDFLVITGDHVENPRKESVRIRRALRGISMPMDILVIPKSKWDQLKDVPGLIYREATSKGKVVYEYTE
ncbi:MAG: nucleotidyltransferase domain-containing protein [Thermodesulfobacteriota bacterium]